MADRLPTAEYGSHCSLFKFDSQARNLTQVLMTWEAPPLLMSNRSASISSVIAVLSLNNTKVNSSFTDSFLCGPVFFADALKFL